MDADRRLTFEGFSLDLANERLVCDGEVVALTPKAFAVLRRLVEDNGKLVTKAELLRAGWPDTHVTDGVLKVSILDPTDDTAFGHATRSNGGEITVRSR